MKPGIEIHYCTKCKWLLRAGWMAQELLTTFEEELGEVRLIPDRRGGYFEILVDNKSVWSRKKEGHFPEMKELKVRVRDQIAPDKDLGHLEPKK